MAKFYIQLQGKLVPVGKITEEDIKEALGVEKLFNFSGNFYELDNNPFKDESNGELKIVDPEGRIIAIVDKDGIHSIEMTAEDESGTVHKLTDKMDKSDFDEIISTDGNNFIIQDEDGNQGFVLTAEGATAHDFITYKGDSLLDIADRVESVESNVGSIDNMISATGNEFIIQDDKANPNVGLKLNSEGLFVKDVILNNREHVLSLKADKTYVDDVKSDMTTELNTKINSLDATVTTSGSTHGVKVSVTQTNGKLSSVSVDDSKIDFTKLTSNPIDVNEESQSFVIKDGSGNKGFVLNSEGAKAKDFTTSTGVSLNGLNTTVVSIRTEVDNINNMISAEEEGSLIIRDNSGNVGLKLNDKGLYVQDVTAVVSGTTHVLSEKADQSDVDTLNYNINARIDDLTTTVSGSGSDYGVTVSVKQEKGLITSVSVNDSGITFDKLNGNPISTTSSEFIIQDDKDNPNIGLKLNSKGLFVKDVTVIDDNKIQHVLSEKADQIDVDGSISGINETITTLAGTVSAISTRVSAAEKSISSLDDRVGTTETSINSLNTTVASLSTRVSATEKSISSLSGTVSSHSSEISTNATNITALTSTVASHTKTITSLSGRVTANEDDISGLSATVGTHTTTITTLTSTVASNKASLEGSIGDLTSTVTSNKDELNGKITALSKTVASNKAALAGSISDLTSTVTSHTSDISTLQITVTSNASKINSLSGRVDANEGAITTLNSTVGTHTTTITTLTSTVASNIAALVGSISDLTSTVTSHTSDISTLQITVTSNASKINSLSGTVSANTSAIASINNITSASATINSNYGKPEVIVSYTGEISNKELNFAFKNLKGDPGAKGSDGYSTYYTSVSATQGLQTVSLSTVTKPSDRTIQVGDFILSPTGNMFRVTGVSSTNVSISHLTSIKGDQGPKGDDGTSVNIKGTLNETSDLASKQDGAVNGDGYLIDGYLYVYTGSGQTYGFENVGEIKGPQGETGPQGPEGPAGASVTIKSLVSSSAPGEASTITFSDDNILKVYNGADGRGITSVTHTSTSSDGLTKTYTIAYTSGNDDTFKVKDGAPGAPGTPGAPGADGRGITSVTHTSTSSDGLTKTYTIAYTSGSPDTFKVKDGAPGAPGTPGAPGEQGYSVSSVVCVDGVDSKVEKIISDTPGDINYYRIKDTNNEFLSGTIVIKNGNNGNDGEDGVSITSVIQTKESNDDGGENEITVTLSNEDEYTFIIKNGSQGPQGETGPKGADGTSVNIKGTLNEISDLASKQDGAVNGDGYLIDGYLYVYTGSGQTYGFENVGEIKGPKGDSITITPEVVDGGYKFIINNVSEGTGDGSGGGVFTGDIFYEDILNAPITMDDSGVLDITDDAGYIIAKINSDGITTTKVKAKNGFYQESDETLKDFHDSIEVDFNALKSIPKAYYTWKDEDVMQIGTSAQKVQELYPEIVSLDEKTGKLTLDYAKLSVIALKAIDLLHEENENLKLELKSLHNEMDKIKSHLGL